MIEQLQTIREFFKLPVPHSPQDLGEYLAEKSKAVQAAAQLEAMAGQQEPVAWSSMGQVRFEPPTCDHETYTPLYAAPVAQQPQAEAVENKLNFCQECGSKINKQIPVLLKGE